ncbi:hypothetical protein B9Z19DRAFT_394012 [Tuber borchii]|uniref:Uncharacterized protein n=1 Tax=Tuber borchii TaxID=42251 RepID=A0A2T6ZHJ7_TUBBO|nr:hypothetical protein B9Z19DRAFT_394012 [Tuber borchii]
MYVCIYYCRAIVGWMRLNRMMIIRSVSVLCLFTYIHTQPNILTPFLPSFLFALALAFTLTLTLTLTRTHSRSYSLFPCLVL